MEDIGIIIFAILIILPFLGMGVYLSDTFDNAKTGFIVTTIAFTLTWAGVEEMALSIHSIFPSIPQEYLRGGYIWPTVSMYLTIIPVFFIGIFFGTHIPYHYAILKLGDDKYQIIGIYEPGHTIETETITQGYESNTTEHITYNINDNALKSWFYMMKPSGAKLYKRKYFNRNGYDIEDCVSIKKFKEVHV